MFMNKCISPKIPPTDRYLWALQILYAFVQLPAVEPV